MTRGEAQGADGVRPLRLGTFNIQHGRGDDGGRPDPERLERALAGLGVDVLALQEVDRLQPRSRGVDQVALAARATGLPWVRFAPTLLGDVRSARTRTPVARVPRALTTSPSGAAQSSGAPAYGVALLSRHPVLAWFVAPLPGPRGVMSRLRGRARHPAHRDGEPRVCLAAVVRAPDGLLVVASTHLTRTPRVAAQQLDVALRGLATLARRSGVGDDEAVPAVLLGDLNLRRAAVDPVRTRQRFPVTVLATARTHPATAPTRQIDHVLGIGPIAAAGPAAAPRLDVSDHRPLTVEVLARRAGRPST